MPRTIAALIRHAEYWQMADTPSAHQPYPLSPEGHQQAEQAAHSLAGICEQNNWTLACRIDSSRMLRAWQTADILRQQLQSNLDSSIALDSYDALAERSMGCAANLSIQQIESVLQQDPRYPLPPPNWKADSHYQLPLQGAESLLQSGQRVATHLIAQMSALQNTVTTDTLKIFVGHGAAFRHAAWQLGVLEFNQIAELSMYHACPVFLEFQDNGHWLHCAGDWKQRKPSDEHRD